MSAPQESLLTTKEAHLQFVASLEKKSHYISLPNHLQVAGDPRFETLQSIPDPTSNERVLFWVLDKIVVPDNPELDPNDFGQFSKTIAKMLARNSMANDIHALLDKMDPSAVTPEFLDRALITNKLYAFLFWYDDNFGNEQQESLTEAERLALDASLVRIASFLTDGILAGTPDDKADASVSVKIRELHRAEVTLVELMADIDRHLPDTEDVVCWRQEFCQRLYNHLEQANKHKEKAIFTVKDFIEFRRQASGMNVAAIMREFNDHLFLPRHKLTLPYFERDNPGLHNLFYYLKTIEKIYLDYGGIGNDAFSASKEIVDEGTQVNLIAVMYQDLGHRLAADDQAIDEVIVYAEVIQKVAQFLIDMKNFFFYVKKEICGYMGFLRENSEISDDEYRAFRRKLDDWEMGIRATFIWQQTKGFPRYMHQDSPYLEFRPDEAYFWQMLAELGFGPELLGRVIAFNTERTTVLA